MLVEGRLPSQRDYGCILSRWTAIKIPIFRNEQISFWRLGGVQCEDCIKFIQAYLIRLAHGGPSALIGYSVGRARVLVFFL